MCGIVGIFDTRERRPIDRDLLNRMNESQHHRGPDEGGLHSEPGIGLGHRRLSIIDLASGQQPLYDDDRTAVIVYNGEVYNFQSLRAELEAQDHRFHTTCDTEVVLHAWQAWGERCVERLRGMFAFAIWDARHETLFMARDRLGIKPLHYALLPDGNLLFGSELKALMLHPGLPREIRPEAVEDYFAYGYIPDPKTIFRHAFKLPPGHTLSVKRGASVPAPRAYWDVPFAPAHHAPESEIGEELIARLREAVDIRMIAEVPLGAFLSGGVDSSAVVAMMAGLSPQAVKTCAIAFGEKTFNEADYAATVARRFATDHDVRSVDPGDFDLIDRLIGLYDEPYADSSAMPTYRVCELARERVTVALSGDGGDENFAGYRRHRWHMFEERARTLLPQPVRGPLFGLLGAVYPKADWAPRILRAKYTLQGIARDTLQGYLHSVGVIAEPMRRRLFSAGFQRELQGYDAIEVFRAHAARAPTTDPLSLIQYLDIKTYLPADILTKVDRASMAHSLEVRVPILDHEFVEWVSGVSPRLKLRGREGKYIFKKALETKLPDEILYRPKMGFGVPLARWFRGPLRHRLRAALLESALGDCGVFDAAYVKTLVGQHQSGLRDHSAPLWALLMFAAFLRRHTEQPSTTEDTVPRKSAGIR